MLHQDNSRSKRKPNFTESENVFLVEEYEKYKEILQQKLNNTEINRQKMAVWRKVGEELNVRNPSVKRTPDEVRRKWKNMITTARREKLQLNPAKSPSMLSQRLLQGCPMRNGLEETSDRESEESAPTERSGEEIKLEPLTTGVFEEAAASRSSTPSTTAPLGNYMTMTETLKTRTRNFLSPSPSSYSVPAPSPLNSIEVVQPAPVASSSFGSQSAAGVSYQSAAGVSYSRSEEVNAAMVSGIEVVQPGPPASDVVMSSGVTHRNGPVRVAVRPKRHRILSLLQNAKKRRLDSTHPSSHGAGFDLVQLQKEKLMLEKEKLVLEKEKLILEKEKLALEIQCLRSQMQNDTVSDSELEN